jgi:hypothetical protein
VRVLSERDALRHQYWRRGFGNDRSRKFSVAKHRSQAALGSMYDIEIGTEKTIKRIGEISKMVSDGSLSKNEVSIELASINQETHRSMKKKNKKFQEQIKDMHKFQIMAKGEISRFRVSTLNTEPRENSDAKGLDIICSSPKGRKINMAVKQEWLERGANVKFKLEKEQRKLNEREEESVQRMLKGLDTRIMVKESLIP